MFLEKLFGHKRRIRKLRKKWDREREKALKLNEPLRSNMLKKLDQIELNLRTLEEQRLHRVELARIAKEVEIDLEEVKAMLDAKDDFSASRNIQERAY
ncbi:MAG: hypothetical protein GXO64_04970 [Candidatus Micrarchaeota archaeon]|nr:hypothetical protein [Candidatus Micrarchaeota archaeon]